jgi:hypothetical protein
MIIHLLPFLLPLPFLLGGGIYFLMMIFFLFIVGTNINKLFKKCGKDTLIRQYSYKIELADNRNLIPPTPRH